MTSSHSAERNESQVWAALDAVEDPELHIPITDLGLIYEVKWDAGRVHIRMTLTTLGCPLFPVIEQQVKQALQDVPGITNIEIDLVFDPPWTMERMSERGKALLGID